ncbi:MAG: tryptophan--tRNA ligase [Flavobacteriaceae bacterium]|nr:tryptophan--tRNA ligase [Flavobacteriaceae bacterium]|tara:strand:- start:37741 stop:38721 length:981 start_codon:yes stop_codon:yes gene_type:complete
MSKNLKRILTGIQSTGTPHLGNILGAIIPAINFSKQNNIETFLFIADFHSLTQIKDAHIMKENTLHTAAAWLAFGLNPEKTIFYRQSDVPQVTELAWYLSCFYPFSRLSLAHSFKDKKDRLDDINSGLFNYPILMAADILLYDAEIIPVGKDQLQHIEITRNIANRFHTLFGKTFIIPKDYLTENTKLITGTDGKKMSKSKNNIINVFADEKILKKQINSITTSSNKIEEPKDWKNCNLFNIYKHIASENDSKKMKQLYEKGGVGFGNIKKELIGLILEKFSDERKQFNYYVSNIAEVEKILSKGSLKAQTTANKVLGRVRKKLGY